MSKEYDNFYAHLLAQQIRDRIAAKSLTQIQAAKLIGIAQSDVSRIVLFADGQLNIALRYSPWKLMVMLAALGCSVSVEICPSVKQTPDHDPESCEDHLTVRLHSFANVKAGADARL